MKTKINLELLKLHSVDKTSSEWADFFRCGKSTVKRACKFLNVTCKSRNHSHTTESRQKISDARKKFLKENPDKHPWRSKDKFQSKPCEKIKEFLIKLCIPFIAEYQPCIDGHFFSIDIALPDKKIALEINGNQHYERDGILKEYYQRRHNLIESVGWKVFEIHYSACFNLEKWTNFIKVITESPQVEAFDYFNYIPREKLVSYDPCPMCGNNKNKLSKNCLKCSKSVKRKKIPTKETLERYIGKVPNTKIAKIFGVSDVTIKKWSIFYNIECPNTRGFWTKLGKYEGIRTLI